MRPGGLTLPGPSLSALSWAWSGGAAAVLMAGLMLAALLGLGAGAPSPHGTITGVSGAGGLHRLTALPLAEQSAISNRLALAEPAFAARRAGDGYRLAGGGVVTDVQANEVKLAGAEGSVSWSAAAIGRGTRLDRLVTPALSAHGNRVLLARPGLLEAYSTGPLGIEQTFTVGRQPGRSASGPLTLALTVSGDLTPRLAASRSRELTFTTPGGRPALNDGGLVATDARGRRLPAWFALSAGRVLIRVDDADAVYPLHIDPLVQAAELTASDGAAGDQLGVSVAVSGGTVAVGSAAVNNSGGAVYVFEEPAGGWSGTPTEVAKLTASDGTAGDELGSAVGIDGSTVVAGAPGAASGGAAYVFTEPGGGWSGAQNESAKLTASNGQTGDKLGSSVGISGSTVVAGAPGAATGGAAYVFEQPGDGWTGPQNESAKLTASDGAANDGLGSSVGISGPTVVAGAPGAAAGGAAYVFQQPDNGWNGPQPEAAKLTASDGAAGDVLGTSVGISGSTVAAGAPGTASGGAAYVFQQPDNGWNGPQPEAAKLTASDGAAGNELGASVGIDGSTVVAGAPAAAGGGVAYVFTEPGDGWSDQTETQALSASDAGSQDHLGEAVGVSGPSVVAGAPGAHAAQGKAYVFQETAALRREPDRLGLGVGHQRPGRNRLRFGQLRLLGSVHRRQHGHAHGHPVPRLGFLRLVRRRVLGRSNLHDNPGWRHDGEPRVRSGWLVHRVVYVRAARRGRDHRPRRHRDRGAAQRHDLGLRPDRHWLRSERHPGRRPRPELPVSHREQRGELRRARSSTLVAGGKDR